MMGAIYSVQMGILFHWHKRYHPRLLFLEFAVCRNQPLIGAGLEAKSGHSTPASLINPDFNCSLPG
jgi:hypothetical protein